MPLVLGPVLSGESGGGLEEALGLSALPGAVLSPESAQHPLGVLRPPESNLWH